LLKRVEDSVIIEFTNPGKNPQMSDLNDLFRSFSRAENSAGITGTGIGLSIVKRVVDYHQGKVQFIIPEPGLNRIIMSFNASS
jgi:signal transduction histidine kinase